MPPLSSNRRFRTFPEGGMAVPLELEASREADVRRDRAPARPLLDAPAESPGWERRFSGPLTFRQPSPRARPDRGAAPA